MDDKIFETEELKQYQLLDTIGKGGFKSVFKAKIAEKVEALKITQLTDLSIVDLEDREHHHAKMLARSMREYEILQKLGGGDLVSLGSVEGHEVRVDNLSYYVYSEEYLDGHTLKIDKTQNNLPSLEDVVGLFRTGINVLRRLNQNGTIHRDIKPQNIMETSCSNRRFVFFDLGIAYQLDEASITSTGYLAPGSELYRAPETLYPDYKDDLDIRGDIFSLALTVFEYASGVHPFIYDSERPAYQIIHYAPKVLTDLRFEIPLSLSSIIGECLKKKPMLRPNFDRVETILNEVV